MISDSSKNPILMHIKIRRTAFYLSLRKAIDTHGSMFQKLMTMCYKKSNTKVSKWKIQHATLADIVS